jgi:folate-dependent phosphoribosylglycinamide formyltransferase PurN
LTRPIRVVLFGGGPGLERGVRWLLCRLEEHADIDLLGAVFQSEGETWGHVARDLVRRRGLLSVPLLAAHIAGEVTGRLTGGRQEAATRRQIRAIRDRMRHVPDIHAPEVLEHVRMLAPHLGLIYGSPILKSELFTIPSLGTLGIHHGALPKYRGKKTTFWEMYHGETHAGVTIQKVNRGLDAGEVVEAGRIRIGNRFRRNVWADVESLGIDLYVKAILDIRHGSAVFTPQPGPRYTLCRDPSPRQLLGLWYRQLRAIIGSPLPAGPGPAPKRPRRKRQ